jgi:hypothetical protein
LLLLTGRGNEGFSRFTVNFPASRQQSGAFGSL